MVKNLKKKKGFTLIELIIVIAILGILAAIAVPKFGEVQKNSKVKADIASAKIIADTAASLVADGTIATGTAVAATDITTTSDKVGAALQAIPKVQLNSANRFFYKIDTNGNVTVFVEAAGTDAASVDSQIYPNSSGYGN